jgi:excisionase family DNA binding protein
VHLGTVVPTWREQAVRCGARLRQLREAVGWSQQRLAAVSGLTNESISRFERGEDDPLADSIRRLAQALGVAPDRFTDDDPIDLTQMTVAQVADRLDGPIPRVQTWLREGRLAGTKVSGQWRVPKIAVDELDRSGRLRGRSRRLDPRYRGQEEEPVGRRRRHRRR